MFVEPSVVNKTLRQQNVPVPWDASSFELLMQEPEFLQDMPTSEVQYWSTYWKDEGPTKEKEKLNLAPRSLDPDAAVPPGSNSDSSIMHVLDACFSANKEAQRTWLQKTLGVGDISESDCDAQCSGVSLESQAMISGYRLFILQGSPNAREVKSHQKDVIYRFIKFIVKPLRTVFNVSTTTLNIFCDESHVGVAFNKGGELFLSLHFYEKWHDQDVLSGRTKEALITWYYTLAHQIAHDSEKLHNAEHVFHNAAICKKHLPSLIALLRTAGLDAEEKGISSSLRMTKDIGIRKELRNVTRWFTGRTRGDERID
ncbi:hypothetical protein FRC02_007725 [Tulasnella sp. 418]|nr:hypothetical protein FRC02_007725 [Tulasnella sp. 418]